MSNITLVPPSVCGDECEAAETFFPSAGVVVRRWAAGMMMGAATGHTLPPIANRAGSLTQIKLFRWRHEPNR